jgi:hypothetical protein
VPLIDAAGHIVSGHREAVALTAFFEEISHDNKILWCDLIAQEIFNSIK